MVAYLRSHSPNFDKAASTLLRTSDLTVKVQSGTIVATGKCPRCLDQFQYAAGTEVTTVDASPDREVIGERSSLKPRLVVLECQCVEDHKGRPDDALGCGASFVVDAQNHSEPEPIKAALALDDREQFNLLTANPDAAIQGSAKGWSAGLSALLALVLAGIWVGGQDAADKLDPFALLPMLLLAGVAIVLHICALVLLLLVSSGLPVTLSPARLRAEGATARSYRERVRRSHGDKIIAAAVLGVFALAPMLIALSIWLAAPAAAPQVLVDINGKSPACGEISDISDAITVTSGGKERVIPIGEIVGITAIPKCP